MSTTTIPTSMLFKLPSTEKTQLLIEIIKNLHFCKLDVKKYMKEKKLGTTSAPLKKPFANN